jgi:hypothetical protein
MNDKERTHFIGLCRELAVYAFEAGLWDVSLVERYHGMVDDLERGSSVLVGLVRMEHDATPISLDHPLVRGVTITFQEPDAETVETLRPMIDTALVRGGPKTNAPCWYPGQKPTAEQASDE